MNGHVALWDRAWAITEDAYRQLEASPQECPQWRAAAVEVEAALNGRSGTGARSSNRGAIAVLGLHNVITYRPDPFWAALGLEIGSSVESLRARLRAAVADKRVSGILLDVDSPGGTVDGLTELAADVRAMGERKPIHAIANTLAASGAYWIASQANHLSVTPSGEVGSIGVVAAHVDQSAQLAQAGVRVTLVHAGERKVDMSSTEPLSERGKNELQARVDRHYGRFIGDVAIGRERPRERVLEDFGKGAIVGAERALEVGMVDAIETFDDALRRLEAATRQTPARRAAMARHPMDFTFR